LNKDGHAMNAVTSLPVRAQLRTLLLREWMQHRFGWTMMILVPFAIAVLAIPVSSFQTADMASGEGPPPEALPIIAALAGVLGTASVMLVIATVASLFFAVDSPRRDHRDRSVEFWMSLPVPHSASLGLPLALHLLVVPAAAMMIGWVLGHAIALLVAMRLGVLAEWAALPWGSLLPATLAITARMASGMVLAALWFAPILMLAVLAYALLKLWGEIALVAALVVATIAEQRFGIRTIGAWFEAMGQGVVSAFPLGGSEGSSITPETLPEDLVRMPGLLALDFLRSLGDLASPTFLGGLVVAGALFAALVVWRQRAGGMA
jgi:ABC-2 type transport system permease protein